MTKQTKSILKTYFDTGDIPTQGQYRDLIDSQLNLAETGTQVAAGTISSSFLEVENDITVLGNITASGNISASGDIFANSVRVSNGFVGTINTVSQPNITSVGTLTGLNVNGNITASGNISASGNIIGATGSFDNGIILTAPNGSKFRFVVNNSGHLSITGSAI